MKIQFPNTPLPVHLLLYLTLVMLSIPLSGQEKVSTENNLHVAGSAGLTNNGISLIPNFSLGDPAAIFNLSVSKGRLSFETDFNFSLEGKPWFILYWLRYKEIGRAHV